MINDTRTYYLCHKCGKRQRFAMDHGPSFLEVCPTCSRMALHARDAIQIACGPDADADLAAEAAAEAETESHT